jgi:hypothetical protein
MAPASPVKTPQNALGCVSSPESMFIPNAPAQERDDEKLISVGRWMG